LRPDETDDAIFYAKDRFVSHLDSLALSTVEEIIEALLCGDSDPAILDLMAGWDSHIPPGVRPSRVVGLGLNKNELEANDRLDEHVLHDLNRNVRLPFPDKTFDAVINTVSVDYMTRPMESFRDVARILKPGGLFLVLFSNRMFEAKATRVWRQSSEDERVIRELSLGPAGHDLPARPRSVGTTMRSASGSEPPGHEERDCRPVSRIRSSGRARGWWARLGRADEILGQPTKLRARYRRRTRRSRTDLPLCITSTIRPSRDGR
jgi:SAM-dependent methyltransferase